MNEIKDAALAAENGRNKESIGLRGKLQGIPLIAWLIGILAAAVLEHTFGKILAAALDMEKIPVLFGLTVILKEPVMIPKVAIYGVLIYGIPIFTVAWIFRIRSAGNLLAENLLKLPLIIPTLIHLGIFYAALHIWSDLSAYRVLTVKLTLIAVMMTLSLNVINGYMGEFSCSHPGFMALGAYAASAFTVGLFADDRLFGAAVLPEVLGPYLFPAGLVIGGFTAAIGALVIAIPSFRTRGDYLAIISLAFLFIVKSLLENLEVVGGPRGMSSQPDYANLPTVFIWCVLCVWIINNFVRSILGKALNAVRDDETAADAMTINTRRTKMIAFMFGAFWAGVAGGLFAHVLRYVNPATFGIQKLAEVLAMVYFGGLNSVYGSIVGAVSLSMLSEALRPLEIFKWIIIPLLLILVMIFRPTGLISFTEFDPKRIMGPKNRKEGEV